MSEVETIPLSEAYYLVVDHRNKSKHLMGYNNQVYPFHYVNGIKKYDQLVYDRPELLDYTVPVNYL